MIQFLFICLGVGNTSRLRWGKAPPAFNLCTINGKDIAQQAKNSFIKDAEKGASVVADVKEAEKVADNTPDRKNTPNTSKTDKMEGENTSKEKNSSDETEGRKVTREDNGQKTGSGVETSGEVKETKVEDIKEKIDDKIEETGVCIIKSTPELEAHIKYTDPTVPRKRGIGGAHNVDEFLKNDIQIVSRKPHPDIKGIEIIEYQLPKLDKTGSPILGIYQSGKPFSKTVYDPKIISDKSYINRGIEAANNALTTSTDGVLPRIWTGVDSQGIVWRGYCENGVITSFYPE